MGSLQPRLRALRVTLDLEDEIELEIVQWIEGFVRVRTDLF
jgi:hypothetical protein